MKIFGFEKLNVWQKARVLSKVIYEETTSLPAQEKSEQVRQSILEITAMLDGLRKSQLKQSLQ